MRWNRFLPFVLTLIVVVATLGVLRISGGVPAGDIPSLTIPSTPPLVLPPDTRADALATTRFEQVLTRLTDVRNPWLRCEVWLRSHFADLGFEGEGLYLRGTDNRSRLEIKTRCSPGGVIGHVLVICDGKETWQHCGALEGETAGRHPAPTVRGPDGVLRSLNGHFQWVRCEHSAGRDILTGVWQDHIRAEWEKSGPGWTVNLARACRLTVDGQGWPGRLEWWGPVVSAGPDVLLAEIEFRNPRFNLELSEVECARWFRTRP